MFSTYDTFRGPVLAFKPLSYNAGTVSTYRHFEVGGMSSRHESRQGSSFKVGYIHNQENGKKPSTLRENIHEKEGCFSPFPLT